VRKLHAFAHQAKYNGMLAGIIACSKRMQANLTLGPITRNAFPTMGKRFRADSNLTGHNFSQPKGGPTGSVFFKFVVTFHNFNIGIWQKSGRLSNQSHQDIDSPAYVWRNQKRDGVRKFLQSVFLVRLQTCCPND
jgi:hypothetical protein